MLRRRLRTIVIPAVAAILVALGLGSVPPVAASTTAPQAAAAEPCGLISAKLVPSCGAWWGIATRPQSYAQLAHLEGEMGRKFDTYYEFHIIGDTMPNAGERQAVAEGRMLHVNLETTKYSWAQVANGVADAKIRVQAQGIASLHKQVFINFDHEPDAAKKAVRGTPAQFVAAFRHVHDLFLAAGATNTVWMWVTTGWKSNFNRLLALYPGNDVVDWISWEAYTEVGCGTHPVLGTAASFKKNVTPMYNWLHTTGAAGGIDATKPIMISEYGATYNTPDPNVTANWYKGIPTALRTNFPHIKAVQKWDILGNCRYNIDTDPVITEAVRVAGSDPYVNQPRSPLP